MYSDIYIVIFRNKKIIFYKFLGLNMYSVFFYLYIWMIFLVEKNEVEIMLNRGCYIYNLCSIINIV